MKETAHIINGLRQGGRAEEPHYAERSYLEGERLEAGFAATERAERPAHETVHIGVAARIVNDDMTPHYMRPENQPTENTLVVHAGGGVTYLPPEEPHYMKDGGREARAEAAAQAVRAAILRGELDPSIFE